MRQTGYGGLFGFWFGQKSRNRGTVCGNSARTDLWGERRVTDASTRTIYLNQESSLLNNRPITKNKVSVTGSVKAV